MGPIQTQNSIFTAAIGPQISQCCGHYKKKYPHNNLEKKEEICQFL